MKVKLNQALAGERFQLAARHVVKCSDAVGQGLIESGVGCKVPDSTEHDGELPDSTAEERAESDAKHARMRGEVPERAIRRAPKTPGSGSDEDGLCTGTTAQGNPCKRKAAQGSEYCDKHAG